MNFFENITFRRARRNSEANKTNESEVSSEILDGTTSSLPDMSNDEIDLTQQLQSRIETLEINLKSAHKEIETLLLENSNLKRRNEELLEKNELYKKVTYSPVKQKSNTPKKKKPLTLTSTQHTQTLQVDIGKKNTHTQTETYFKPLTEKTMGTTHEKVVTLEKQSILERSEPKNLNEKKICILSTNKKHKVLSAAEYNVPINKTFELCHFLTPNVGVKQLIKGLDTKLSKFTKNDYCIILIGEEDFKNPSEHFNLSLSLKQMLQKVNNTNIILCLPTHKYYTATNIYNWRVDNFSKLLHLEVQAHKHVFVFDPNKNGTYDSSMIHKLYGCINNSGMKAIFRGLYKLINEIDRKYINYKIQETAQKEKECDESHMQFFRK